MKYDIDILIVQLRDGRADTRAEAARTLCDHPDVLAKADLIRCTEDRDEKVRYWAITALSRLDDPALLKHITDRLQDPEASVRMAAARVLAKRPTKEACASLLEVLDDRSENVGYWVSAALTRLGTYALPQLVGYLGDRSWLRRQAAARTILRIGMPATAPLIKALARDNANIRFWSLLTLGELRAREAVGPILPFLKSDESETVAAAATSLGQIGDKEAIPHLLPLLGHRDEGTRLAAVNALACFGDVSVRVLTQLLAAGRRQVRVSASQSLALVGDASLKKVLETLGEQNTELRFWAIKALERFANPVIIPVFVGLLDDETPDIQLAAAGALGHFHLEAPVAQNLLSYLGTPDWRVRRALAESLAAQEHLQPDVFRPGLKAEDDHVRFWTVRILGKLGSEKAVPMLMTVFDDRFWPIRREAAESVARVGKAAAPYLVRALTARPDDGNLRYWITRSMCGVQEHSLISVLIPLLTDRDNAIRSNAEEALVSLGEEAVQSLITALRTRESRLLRSQISNILVRIGTKQVDLLLKLFQFNDPEINYWTTWVLGHLGPRIVQPAIETLKGGNEQERFLALKALGYIDSPDTRTACVQALEDEYVALRKLAAETLGRLKVTDAIPVLRKALDDAEDDYRQVIVEAFGRLGDDDVIDVLVEHLDHDRWEIRKEAVIALGRLGSPDAVFSLLRLLEKGSDGDLHVFVLRSLGTLGSPKAVDAIVGFLRSTTEELVLAALEALGALRAKGVALHVQPFLSARSWEVKKTALETLAAIRTVESIEPVKRLLRSDDLVLHGLARTVMRTILGDEEWGRILDVAVKRALREPADRLYEEALESRRQGRAEEALRKIRAALRRHGRPAYYALLGSIHLDAGRLDLAKTNFQKGIRLAPEDALLQSRMAMTLFLRGDTDEAAALFRNLVESPSTPDAVAKMAQRTLARMGVSRAQGEKV